MNETRGIDYNKAYARGIEDIENNKELHPKNKKLILSYLRDAELGKTILKGRKKKIGIKRLVRSLGFLRKMGTVWFTKPFDEITQQEMEVFILNLERGLLTYGENKKSYTPETQASMKRFIRKYWKWLKGNNRVYPPEVEWIDTSCEHPELPIVTVEEFEILLSHTNDPALKFLLVSMFTGGLRREEFFTLRMENYDISDDVPVMNIQVSKTYKRPVGVDLYADVVKHYLTKVHPEKSDLKAFAYPKSEASATKALRRLIKKALPHKANEKNMSFHMLRRSSATYYAQYLSHFQMCTKYGWSMNSSMPQRYIPRANVVVRDITLAVRKAGDEKKNVNLDKMKVEFNAMKMEMEEMQGRLLKKEKENALRLKDSEFTQLLMQRILENPAAKKEDDIKKKALMTVLQDKELLKKLQQIRELGVEH